MPYPSEHAARLLDPDQFDDFRRDVDALGDGIDALYGLNADGPALQSIRFDASRHTEAAARTWLDEHGHKPILFEPATDEADAMTTDLVRCAVAGDEFQNVPQAAARALRTDQALEVKARVYQSERVRLYAAPILTDSGMMTVAASLAGSPINYEHREITDADPMQGVVRGAWVDDGGIYADLAITGDRVLSELAAEATAKFSIEYTFHRADVLCSNCGTAWFDMSADCRCIPGQIVEGSISHTQIDVGEGVGIAFTHRPAAVSTGITALASASESVDLMAPALARLAITEAAMADNIESVDAAAAPAESPAEAQADDLTDRLAAAEAENTVWRERVENLEAAQARSEQVARGAANRQHVIDMARAGRVADVRRLIELRATAPATLSTLAELEAFVDAVVECTSGTGIRAGQVSEAVLSLDAGKPSRDDIERRAVRLSAEKEIPFSEARRLAYREEG